MKPTQDSGISPTYDCIFVGAGILCILEALHLSRCGKSVLMIDDRAEIGGVWTPIELFGLTNVENAVHYFLDNPAAFPYMKDVLGWSIEPTAKKFRLFAKPIFGVQKIAYDDPWGRYLAHLREHRAFLKSTATFLTALMKGQRHISRYIRGGTSEIYNNVKGLLEQSNIVVSPNTLINKIILNPVFKNVEVTASGHTWTAKTLYVTHGSRIGDCIYIPEGKFSIAEQRHPRPQVHFLVRDRSPNEILEGIFVADPLIKYVHDITRFTKEASELAGKKKLFVIALQMDCENSPDLIRNVFQKMKDFAMVGSSAVLEEYQWWDTLLPALDDAILENLQARFSPLVAILKTEDFTAGIAHRAKDWLSSHSQGKSHDRTSHKNLSRRSR